MVLYLDSIGDAQKPTDLDPDKYSQDDWHKLWGGNDETNTAFVV